MPDEQDRVTDIDDGRSSGDASDDGEERGERGREGGGRVFRSAAARRRAVAWTLAVAGVLAVATVTLWLFLPAGAGAAWVRARLATLGPLAPVGFVALQTVQVVLAPVPGQLLGGVGGYLFGTTAGVAYSLLGIVLGSLVVFLASRRYGRPFVESVLDPDALERWDGFVDRSGAVGLFVLFLLPAFPDDLLCFVAGVSRIRPAVFLALVVVGRTPTLVVAAYAGTTLSDGRVVTTIGIATVFAVVTVVVYVGRDRLVAAVDRAGG